jgi:N-acetylmuramoyl-L-alanine amidase
VLKPAIVDWPITWNAERTQLAALYFQVHKGWDITPSTDLDALTTMDPQVVVVHWTAGPSAKGAFNTFRRVRQRGQRIRRAWNAVNLAAHFIVDRDGTIFQLMPETRMGRHTIGLNHLAIGIENVGDGQDYPLTEAQVHANADLVRWLHWRHELTHVIGHYEYRDFEGHPYFVETLDWFRTGRVDPGEDFMADLRSELDGLGLEGAPRRDG